MITGIIVYKTFGTWLGSLFLSLLYTEQTCSVETVLAKFTIIFEQIFPSVIPVVFIVDAGFSAGCSTVFGVTAIVCAGKVATIVVTKGCTGWKTFYRQQNVSIGVDEEVTSCLILVGIDIGHRVNNQGLVHRFFIILAVFIFVDTIRTLLYSMFNIRGYTTAISLNKLGLYTNSQPFV